MIFDNEIPRRWHAVEWYIFLIATLYVWHNAPKGWDTSVVVTVLGGLTLILAIGQQVRYTFYFAPEKEKETTAGSSYKNLNPQYKMDTTGVKMDAERMFARALIAMRNGNLDVNLTESFWIADKPDGKQNRWVMFGGRSRADFVSMLDDRWLPFGAIEKVGGQGKRTVKDWQKIRQIEQGYKC